MMRFRRIEKDMGGMANVGLDQQHIQGKEDDVSTAESKTYIGSDTKTKVDMNKIKNTKIGDDIHYYVNGIEGRGIVVKMGSQYLDLFQQDGNVKTININDTFFVKDILVNKQWDNMDDVERYEALQKIHAPTPRFIIKSWGELPDDIKELLRKDGGLSGGSGSTYEAGETKDSETQDHARTGFAQNTQYDSSVKEKSLEEVEKVKQLDLTATIQPGKQRPSGRKALETLTEEESTITEEKKALFKGNTGTVYKSWLESFVTKPEAVPKGDKRGDMKHSLSLYETLDREEAERQLTPNQFKTWEKEEREADEENATTLEYHELDFDKDKKRAEEIESEDKKRLEARSATGSQPVQRKTASAELESLFKGEYRDYITKPAALPKGSKGSTDNLYEEVTSDEEEARRMFTPNQFKQWKKEESEWFKDADRREKIGDLSDEQESVEAQRSATGSQPVQSKKAELEALFKGEYKDYITKPAPTGTGADGPGNKPSQRKLDEQKELDDSDFSMSEHDWIKNLHSMEGQADEAIYGWAEGKFEGEDELTSEGEKTGKKDLVESYPGKKGTKQSIKAELEALFKGKYRELAKAKAFRKLKPVYEGDTKESTVKSDVEQGTYSNPGSTPEVGVSTDTKVDVPVSTGYEERPHISVEEAGKLPRATFNPHGNDELHVRGSQDSKDQPKFNQPVSQNQPVRKVGAPDQHPNYGVRYGMKGGVKKVWCPEHQVWEETTKDWHE